MKKLILSAITALAFLFGFASCSGDLHDSVVIDPNAMEGYWSYSVFDASQATSGSVGVIVSVKMGTTQSGAFGSPDFVIPATAGSVQAIIWDGSAGSDLSVSTRTDCPSLESLGVTLQSNEFVIIVFTKTATCDLWVYDSEDSDANLSGGTWPGVSTTATVTVEKPSTVSITPTVIATGLPEELNGTILYFTGNFNGWATPGTEKSIECTVSNGSVSVLLPSMEIEAEGFTLVGKFANTDRSNPDDLGWAKPEICGVKDNGEADNMEVNILPNAFCVVGTYKNTLGDADKQYICDWEVGSAYVEATGLPEELNGTTLYFTGNFNGWATPGTEKSIECTVSNGSVSVLLPSMEIEAEGFTLVGKFANTDRSNPDDLGWAKPEICGVKDNGEADNMEVNILPNALRVVGTYKNTLGDTDKQYICDWEAK